MLNIRPGSTAMIGSMPFADGRQALELLNRFPLTIPSWPQLPKRSFREAMVPQCSEGFPGLQVDEAEGRIWVSQDEKMLEAVPAFYENVVAGNLDALAMTEANAAGLHAFLSWLKARPSNLPFVKGQVTGPFTFGLGLADETGRNVWFDEQYRDIVVKGLTKKALWQARELGRFAETVILFLDEPIFSALGTPAYMGIQDDTVVETLNEIFDELHQAGHSAGVHCCGNMDWGLLARTRVDIISFDAFFYGDKVALYPAEIRAFLERGGALAFGIVPTNFPPTGQHKVEDENADSLRRKLDDLLGIFVSKGIPRELLRRMILTPSCGMGSLTAEETGHVLKVLSELRPGW